MKADVLNGLFKPYELKFQSINDYKGKNARLNKFIELLTHVDVDEKIRTQCSKSADRTCANIDCRYNLLKYNYFECSNGDADE